MRRFWEGAGGGREVLSVAAPLMLGQVCYGFQIVVNRIFLTWYSPTAMAGAVTGLFAALAIVGLFVTTGEYLTTFVAQYIGAGRQERVGPALWQGIYFSFAAGLLVAALAPFAPMLFALTGHDPGLVANETAYAQVLLYGALFPILMATLSTFFAGRGKTRVVLVANLVATAVNAVLAYVWIFGKAGFAPAGVVGGAGATVVSQAVGCAFYIAIVFSREHRARYRMVSGWRFDRDLFARLLRFGLPAGGQYALELAAFAAFLAILGRVSTRALAATGIAFNLNVIVFLPLVGLSLGVSSLVGRHLGAGEPAAAERTVLTAFRMGLVFVGACGALYVFAPRLLLAPYAVGADPAEFAEVGRIAAPLLRFIAVYSVFDLMTLVFAAGLKGAGDTRYPMRVTVMSAVSVMLVPAYVLCVRLGAGIYAGWTAASAYVAVVGLVLYARFRAGAWKSLRVIEAAPA